MMKKILVSMVLFSAASVCGRFGLATKTPSNRYVLVEVFSLPPGRVLRDSALGWRTVLADLLFIRANLYYGEHIQDDENLPWLDGFIDSLLEVDPDFKAAYLWAALVSKYRRRDTSLVPRSALQRSIEILKRGARRFPNDYRFFMRVAFELYYEQGKMEEALPYFEKASRLPGAPRWLREKLVDLYNKKGEKQLARMVLEHLIASTEDERLATGLRDRLLTLMRQKGKRLDVHRKKLLKAWKKEFPYVSFDLYLTIDDSGLLN